MLSEYCIQLGVFCLFRLHALKKCFWFEFRLFVRFLLRDSRNISHCPSVCLVTWVTHNLKSNFRKRRQWNIICVGKMFVNDVFLVTLHKNWLIYLQQFFSEISYLGLEPGWKKNPNLTQNTRINQKDNCKIQWKFYFISHMEFIFNSWLFSF